MPELTEEEVETLRAEARHEGRMEREREWQELENTRRLTELEARLDSLTTEVVTAPPQAAEIAEEAPPEAEAEAEEAAAETEEVAHVQAPPEPEAAPEKQAPKFRIL